MLMRLLTILKTRIDLLLIIIIFVISILWISYLILLGIDNIWFLFYSSIFSFCIVLAIAIILTRSPIYSLLCLIGVFFIVIIFLLITNIEFLAFILLIVYIGAISILFLFVIMMFNLKQLTQPTVKPGSLTTIINFVLLIIILKFYLITQQNFIYFEFINLVPNIDLFIKTIPDGHEDIINISLNIYTLDAFLLITSGCLLLTAMLGAIILALSTLESKFIFIRVLSIIFNKT